MSWLYSIFSFLTGEIHPAWYAILIIGGGIAVLGLVPGVLPFVQFWWSRLPSWAKITLGGLSGAVFLYFLGRYKGTQDAKAARKGAEAKAVKTRLETVNKVGKMTPDQREAAIAKYYRKED